MEWQRVSPLEFIEVSPYADADIKISFARGDHEDGYPFDGSGRVLAHAFAPGSGTGGDVHLDDDEMWTVRLFGDPLANLISLRAIVLHELGHSLGLAHSDDVHSIMYAFYQHSLPPELTPTDIHSIQSLYGVKKNYYDRYRDFKPSTTTTSTTTTSPPSTVPKLPTFTRDRLSEKIPHIHSTQPPLYPDICSSSIDAVTGIRGEFFVFKDKWLWRFRRNGELRSGPSLISGYWPELPGKVDAAVEDGSNVMFFAGNECYIYNAHSLLRVRTLSDFGLPADVKKIRLVYTWNYWPDEPIYIWAENGMYWKYDRKSEKVELGYPREINVVWHNVREDTSAAATLNSGKYVDHIK
uniref:ZnMc domain-containing protein n=1 Tax=Syphacia muris TaxID=451379 RepID=A0A158R5E0_9BILA